MLSQAFRHVVLVAGFCAFGAVVTRASPVIAAPLFSNFGSPTSAASSTALGVFPGNSTITRKGLRFTTGSVSYTLTDVQADFALDSGTAPATVTATLYPGIGGGTALGFPDGSANGTSTIPSPVATFAPQTVGTPAGVPLTFTFAANGSAILQPNTTYLMIFATNDSVRARWYNPVADTALPVAESSSGFSDARYGLYTGGSMSSVGSIASSNTAGRIRLNGEITVIPEAGTLTMLAGGAVFAFAGVLRRRMNW